MKGKLGRNKIDISGNRYGMLTAVKFYAIVGRRTFWECLCDCGNIHQCDMGNLKNGSTTSCGCHRNMILSLKGKTHGEAAIKTKTKEYRTWIDIKTRCYNAKESTYQYYGGKGIAVCDRWMNSYEDFLTDMGRAPSPNHSIERNDVKKGYEPSNCRWATRLEQMNNTSKTLRVEFKGAVKPFSDWCRELGLKRSMVYQRIHKLKWDVEKAFTTPCTIQ